MILAAWITVVGLAALFTVGWLHIDREHSVQATGGLAFVFWSVGAVSSRSLTVASGGSTLDVSSDVLAVTLLVPAVLSAVAVAGAQSGVYPPESAGEDDTNQVME